ncbi:MAG: FxsA family protein, partial [Thermodesulfobacteriota bacterium]
TIGTLNTFMLVILSGFLGAYLARIQGMQTMLKVRSDLDQGILPAEELVDALIIFAAGIVLLTPGFFTDTFGLLLLFPPSRFHFKRYIRKKFDQWIQDGSIRFHRLH